VRDCVHTACEDDMLEIARQLERTAVWFYPVILIGPGLVCVLLGLFIWLGGLGFKKVLVAIVGAVSGGICGFFMSGRDIVTTLASAALAAVIAIKLERIFITILAGVLAAILGFAVLARPYIESGGEAIPVEWDEVQGLSVQQTIEKAKAYITDFVDETKWILSRMSVYNWAIIAALAVIFAAAGFFWRHLIAAFCCAAVGSILIFAGMILLLLYKGAAPISRICQNQLFYQGIFGIMTAFGMAEQLLLCQRIKERLTGKRRKSRDGKEPEETASWRNK
jgi:hypothetical protein